MLHSHSIFREQVTQENYRPAPDCLPAVTPMECSHPRHSREGIVSWNFQLGYEPSMPVEALGGLILVQCVQIDAAQAIEAGIANQSLHQLVAQTPPSPLLQDGSETLCSTSAC